MGKVTIVYSNVELAADYSHDAGTRVKKYSSNLESMIGRTLQSLLGNDSLGHVSAALSNLRNKESSLNNTASALSKGESTIDSIEKKAKSVDKKVASSINEIAETYVGDMTFLQKAGSVLYNIFCVEGGALASEHGFGKAVSKVRKSLNKVKSWREKTREWFKYGEGQYVWNQVKAGLKVVGAGIAVITAGAAAVIASPGMAVVAAIGVVAAGVYMATQIGNAATVMSENERARKLDKQGKRGLARYYGDTGGVRDYITKHDFGGKKANGAMKYVGLGYDFVEKTSKGVRDVCGIILAWMTPSKKTSFDGRKVDKKHIDDIPVKERLEIVRKEKEMEAMKKVYKYERKNPRTFTSPHHFSISHFVFGDPVERTTKYAEKLFSKEEGFPLKLISETGKMGEKALGLGEKSDYQKVEEYLTNGPESFGDNYEFFKSALSLEEKIQGLKGVIEYTPVKDVLTVIDDGVDIIDVFTYDDGSKNNIYTGKVAG